MEENRNNTVLKKRNGSAIIGSTKSFAKESERIPVKETSKLMTVPDIARMLKVTPQYVRKLISEGKLNAERIGTQWVVSQEQLQAYIDEYDVLIEPDDHERLDDDIPEIVALSFFSGAMGLDIGMAQGGIKALLACEFNKYCRMTINENEPNMALIGDINAYSPDEILRMAKIPKGTKVDVIFGGPPCQAFSTAGARRALSDERGNVFLRYIDVVQAIRPTYVVIENVRGLLSAPYPYDDVDEPIKGGALCVIMDRLAEAGYTISFELYNAANFGAPQIRERVVMIGKLGNEKVSYLAPTHDENGAYGFLPWRTLADALKFLPSDVVHHNIDFPEKTYGPYTFQAGNYEALEVVIGEGEGHNWWCVMYPNLCFFNSTYEVVDAEAEKSLEQILTPEEYQSLMEDKNYEIKFAFLDFWKDIKESVAIFH